MLPPPTRTSTTQGVKRILKLIGTATLGVSSPRFSF